MRRRGQRTTKKYRPIFRMFWPCVWHHTFPWIAMPVLPSMLTRSPSAAALLRVTNSMTGCRRRASWTHESSEKPAPDGEAGKSTGEFRSQDERKPRRMAMKRLIRFNLNGRSVTIDGDDERLLLWVLRTEFSLTGAKYGCGQGFRGTCTVLVDGKAVRSCLTPLKAIDATDVTTIEGLARDGKLQPLQQAFIDH